MGPVGEAENRRLRQIWGAIERFAEGKSTLGEAVPELERLLGSLEQADPAWKERFRAKWEVLRRATSVTREVEQATTDLRALVAEVLPADEREE